MRGAIYILLNLVIVFFSGTIVAQDTHEIPIPLRKGKDSVQHERLSVWSYKQLDLIDIGLSIIKRNDLRVPDSTKKKSGRVFASPIPAVGYSLQTGFEVSLVSNLAFYNWESKDANISTITSSLNYTQMHQFIFPIESSLWTRENKYNIQTNWQYAKFPQATYGLGGYTKLSDGYTMDFSNLRLHTTVLKTVAPDVSVGLGYNFDYYWNVREVNPPQGVITDLEKYGISATSFISGVAASFQYDTRRNSINPQGGNLVNVVYAPNFTFLGSDQNWQSLVADLRKFIRFPASSQNVLALWNYDWFTMGSGKAPYVSLPNTGGDPYGNTGRGYTEGRFRGREMLYLEGEYRFGIMRNGLLGGVVFSNLESFSEPVTNRFEVVHPGFGAGLRIKFNKYSRTNVAIDYAFGTDGSKGFFLNLGEIF